MRLAVMQPYLFPYIGYFQLIKSSDIFIIYDDVTYIKQGYINRNSILVRGERQRFTIPVPGASSYTLIKDLEYSKEVGKILKTISQAYFKAPYYGEVFPIIREIFESEERKISDLCLKSYEKIFDYLGVEQTFMKASDLEYNRDLSAADRLVQLCRMFEADYYINPVGGMELYSKDFFQRHQIQLCFLEPVLNEYKQENAKKFVPGLSIIDCLMSCSPAKVKSMIYDHKLV